METFMRVVWTTISMGFAYGLFVVLLPSRILSLNTHVFALNISTFRYFGLIFIVLGAMNNLKCYWDLVFTGRGSPDPALPTNALVAKGIYRYTRNPVYLGFFLILIGEAIYFVSILILVYSFVWFLIFNLIVVFIEEPSLKKRFGESYNEYLESVPRWIPRFIIFGNDNVKNC